MAKRGRPRKNPLPAETAVPGPVQKELGQEHGEVPDQFPKRVPADAPGLRDAAKPVKQAPGAIFKANEACKTLGVNWDKLQLTLERSKMTRDYRIHLRAVDEFDWIRKVLDREARARGIWNLLED